ncbi:transcriptional regulatory protein-like protein [Candidatus Koribacter versatilis Ellin345]|uniref:Transcriptional regulatory protein-like protein n=1 Tax=Koribacter versatilis (strain Ellin345) TaxID=204669 RepID=Q1IIZ5_KORVE|nr:winged helix-turn-helix domain-containing protein [Candidatus Koribacter versatilis]ABF43155.1 transcriptional regulatory protein-like protein [Candidatus Koribacter versatilis Ellin345]
MKGSFHIADWEVEPQINQVRRQNHSFHLEPKVMQVLVELAAHSDEVLSKEHLIHAVWSDTFVSDDVLTRCISEIRRVLDDDARAPKIIQTIPKSGYRLIAPVVFDKAAPPKNGSSNGSTATVEAATVETPPLKTAETPRKNLAPWIVAVGVLAIAVVYFAIRATRPPVAQPGPEESYRTIPFTSYPGSQTQPAFSPDGNQVAFVWNGEGGENRNIYVKIIGSETPLQLTHDAGQDYSPTWSPDGRSIAFLRYTDTDRGIFMVPALGGAEHKVFTPTGIVEWERNALSWSPDGKRLIFSDGKSANSPSSIFELDLETGTAKAITSPPKLWDGDSGPAFSPDGKKIAFVRGSEGWVQDLYVMDAAGGEPTRLTNDGRMMASISWAADGKSIVYSSNRAGKFSLWRIPATGGTAERIGVGTEDAFGPSVSRNGDHLAYTQGSSIYGIHRLDLKAPKSAATTILSSTQQDSAPKLSPDGSRVAFQSWRSGTQEVWVAGSDGKNPERVTSFEKSLTGSPSWSPDGKQLAFDARPEGRSHIYALRLDGGQPKAVTDGDFNDILPNWSSDGKWVYFASNRGGAWQIWKAPSEGGTPQQVTKHGGFVGQESFDGKWLYFAKPDAVGLFRMPVSGGDEQKIMNQPPEAYWGYWSLTPNGIYYLNETGGKMSIEFAELDGTHPTRVHVLERGLPPFSGLSVTPDGKTLLYNDRVEAGSHITLVDGFR